VDSRCRGTTIICCVADLRRCLPTTSVTSVQQSARYCGALPCWHLCMMTPSYHYQLTTVYKPVPNALPPVPHQSAHRMGLSHLRHFSNRFGYPSPNDSAHISLALWRCQSNCNRVPASMISDWPMVTDYRGHHRALFQSFLPEKLHV